MKHVTKFLTPEVRRWVYGVCLAALPVLIFYDLVDEAAAPLWGGFLLALFNVQDED